MPAKQSKAKGDKPAGGKSLLHLLCCCCWDSGNHTRPIRSSVVDWRTHPVVLQYQLLEVIGEGGFSEVWLAQHVVTGDKAALKVVYLSKPGLEKEQAAVLESEAKFLQLLDHPHIIHCKAVLETKYDLVLVLEHLPGGELLDHLHLVQHYDEAHAAQLFRQVVDAVAHMHDLNIMHRDIKPENVMFVRPVQWYHSHKQPMQVKLIDFGMAAVYQSEDSYTGCLGSPGFIAPEVVRGGEHTPAMDIYALGVLLFVLLTGRKPFELRDVRSLAYASMPICSAPGLQDARFITCSKEVQELVVWMMADNPNKRPTARQVLKHAWVRGLSHGTSRLVIDSVVRRRMQQLANLRRYKGLAFALMMNTDTQLGSGGLHHAHSITSRQSSSSSQASLSTHTPQPHLARHSRLWYNPSDHGPGQEDSLGEAQLDRDALQYRRSTPVGSSNDLICSQQSVPRMKTTGALLELSTTSCPTAKLQARHLHTGIVGSAGSFGRGLDRCSQEVGDTPSLHRVSRLDSPCGSSFIMRRAPESLLRAIQQQRKLIHQEMKSRARVRREAEQQQQLAAGQEPDAAASGLLAAITEEGTSVRGGRLVHLGRQLSQALTRKLSGVLTPTSRASLGNAPHPANSVAGSPGVKYASGRLTASPDRLSRELQRPVPLDLGKACCSGRAHESSTWNAAQLAAAPSSCGSQQLLLGQLDEPSVGHGDRPSRISRASLSSAPSQTSEQPLLGGVGLQHHLPPSDHAFHLLRGTTPCTSVAHSNSANASRGADRLKVTHHPAAAIAVAADAKSGSGDSTAVADDGRGGIGHIRAVPECNWHALAPPVRTAPACPQGQAGSAADHGTHDNKRQHGNMDNQPSQQQLMMDLSLVATALQAAPQLQRCWTAPEPGTLPNLLENAVGAAAPRMQGSMEQPAQQARALSLDLLALAFLDGEQQLRQMLGDAAADMVMNYTVPGRAHSIQTAGGASQGRTGSGAGSAGTAADTSADLEQYPYVKQLLATSPASLPHLLLDTPRHRPPRPSVLVQPLQAPSYLMATQSIRTSSGGGTSLLGVHGLQIAHQVGGMGQEGLMLPAGSAGRGLQLSDHNQELHLQVGLLCGHGSGTHPRNSHAVAIPLVMHRHTTSPFPSPPPEFHHIRALVRRPSWIEHSTRVRHGNSPLGSHVWAKAATSAPGSGRLLLSASATTGTTDGACGTMMNGASRRVSVQGAQDRSLAEAEAAVQSAMAIIPPSARRAAASAFEAFSYLPFSWASNGHPQQPPHCLSRISSASSRSGSSLSSSTSNGLGLEADADTAATTTPTPAPTPLPSFGRGSAHIAAAEAAVQSIQQHEVCRFPSFAGAHERQDAGAVFSLQLGLSRDGSLHLVPSISQASLHVYAASQCGSQLAGTGVDALPTAQHLPQQHGFYNAHGFEAAVEQAGLQQSAQVGEENQQDVNNLPAVGGTVSATVDPAAMEHPFSQQHDCIEDCEMCSGKLSEAQLAASMYDAAGNQQQEQQGVLLQPADIRQKSSQPIPVPINAVHQGTLRGANAGAMAAVSGPRGIMLSACMSWDQDSALIAGDGSLDM